MIDEKKLIEELEDWKNESPDTEEESIWNNAINQLFALKVIAWKPCSEPYRKEDNK